MSRNDKSCEDKMQENNILTELSDDITNKNINPRQRTVMRKQSSEDLNKDDDADTKVFNKD